MISCDKNFLKTIFKNKMLLSKSHLKKFIKKNILEKN